MANQRSQPISLIFKGFRTPCSAGMTPALRQPAGAAEAVASQFADDDVVEQLDAEDFAGLADSRGQADVVAQARLA